MTYLPHESLLSDRAWKSNKKFKATAQSFPLLLAGKGVGGGGTTRLSVTCARRCVCSGSPLLHHSTCAGKKLLFPVPTCLGIQKDKSMRCVLRYQAFKHCSTGSLCHPGLQMVRALLSSRSSPNLQTLLIILPDTLICVDIRAEFGPFYK